uniref:Uncharacterized protein n=1 Tax=Anguilla anguilla TaxID=7936 RepID=A0A0E9SXT1_ANGAN
MICRCDKFWQATPGKIHHLYKCSPFDDNGIVCLLKFCGVYLVKLMVKFNMSEI